jgi:hypothetical protein
MNDRPAGVGGTSRAGAGRDMREEEVWWERVRRAGDME